MSLRFRLGLTRRVTRRGGGADDHALGVTADEVSGRAVELVGQQQRGLFVAQAGDDQLPDRSVIVPQCGCAASVGDRFTACLDPGVAPVRLGLLQRRAAGRAYLYSLKRSHRLVRHLVGPIFRAEEAAPTRFTRELAEALGGQCLSAMVYGSVARGEAHSASDVDLFVVVRDEQAVERFARKVQPKAEKLVREGWSLMLEVNVKSRSQLLRSWNSSLVKKIRKEGQLVAGSPLEEVKHVRRLMTLVERKLPTSRSG